MRRKSIALLVAVLCGLAAFAQSGRSLADPLRMESGGNEAWPVRNLIYLIGDGMGLSQVSMLSVESDYQPTAFDRAQNVAMVVTRSANNRVTDSAAAGTALATGYKTNNGMVGVRPDSSAVVSIMERAVGLGRPAGIVVTSMLQHATPAAFYAHVPYRHDYRQVSEQLVESGLTVAFGGGYSYVEGMCVKRLQEQGYTVLDREEQLDTLSHTPVMGFFAEEHLPSKQEGRGDFLPEATRTALELLAREADRRDAGFVLMVEGSQIDMEGHANDAQGVLAETADFEQSVAVAMDFADSHPGTLVVVTADHETGGLSLPSCDSDFEQAESGVEPRFGTEGHTATFVPVFLYGAGAERINGLMDNTRLAELLMEALGVAEE